MYVDPALHDCGKEISAGAVIHYEVDVMLFFDDLVESDDAGVM